MPIAERDEIARLGYEAVAGQDTRAASEALRLFISDTVGRGVAAQRDGATALLPTNPDRCCGATQSAGK
jgi:hypothetical protein